MNSHVDQILPASLACTRRRAFTLTELLVVIGIIVIMLALAVPLFNIFHGGRSVEAGENIVSSMLQRARARAIWTQERRGVFFFTDQGGSGKTAMVMVRMLDVGPNALELDEANPELEYLPAGVGAAFMQSKVLPKGSTPPTGTAPPTDYKPFGLILFDGLGRTEGLARYQLAIQTGTTALISQYGYNIEGQGNVIGQPNVPGGLGTDPNQPEFTSVAVGLFDNTKLGDLGGPPNTTTFQPQQQPWLEQNVLALVVNRYNGTLFRGE